MSASINSDTAALPGSEEIDCSTQLIGKIHLNCVERQLTRRGATARSSRDQHILFQVMFIAVTMNFRTQKLGIVDVEPIFLPRKKVNINTHDIET